MNDVVVTVTGGKRTTIHTLLVTPSEITPVAWWHGGKSLKS